MSKPNDLLLSPLLQSTPFNSSTYIQSHPSTTNRQWNFNIPISKEYNTWWEPQKESATMLHNITSIFFSVPMNQLWLLKPTISGTDLPTIYSFRPHSDNGFHTADHWEISHDIPISSQSSGILAFSEDGKQSSCIEICLKITLPLCTDTNKCRKIVTQVCVILSFHCFHSQ